MIIIADYIGHMDDNNKPIGHPVKVASEMFILLSEKTNVCVAAPEMHLREINKLCNCNTIILPNGTYVFQKEGLRGKIKRWKNLDALYRADKQAVYLFINVDFLLFAYLFFHPYLCKKSWIVLCFNPLLRVNIVRKKIVHYILKRVGKIIVTNKHFADSIKGTICFAPDYYYDTAKYDRYINCKKIERMVSLGTTGETKQLESLVEVMNGNSIPLYIIGSFEHNLKRYDMLKSISKNNVTIQNRYIDSDEYYEIIAESLFVVLPYDMDLYDQRTSGILLEAMFLNSIPIAPKKLLEFNDIAGLGYESIKDIPELLKNSTLIDEVMKKNTLKKKEFLKESVIEEILTTN